MAQPTPHIPSPDSIVVEIVDETEKITAFLPELEKMMPGGLITMERAQVYRYAH